jgi:hypothetical protein
LEVDKIEGCEPIYEDEVAQETDDKNLNWERRKS